MKQLLTVDEFEQAVTNNKLVVVDFFATWCGPCQVVGPKFEELSKKYPHVAFFKVDVDEAGDVAEECSITAMPTFLFFANGSPQGEPIMGANIAAIEDRIKQLGQ